MRILTERRMKRWREQRWLLDQVIQANGLDWDQARTHKIIRNCGPTAVAEIREISRRVQKFGDIPREFHRAAQRREKLAREAEEAGHGVDARLHYYVASIYYAYAQWAIFEDDNPKRTAWEERKKACYDGFIRFAGRRIDRVELPFEGKSIAALLHFPPGLKPGEKLPSVISIQGMDAVKEETPLYGDLFLERGIALLSIDPPGRGETRSRGIKATAANCEQAGKAACDYLCSRPEIDSNRLGIFGWSMGTYWGTRVAAAEPRIKACALGAPCFEPGQHTLLNMASPTFKLNYMNMAGYDDEEAFDEFAKSLTLEAVASNIVCPYFVIAGEDDELCPVESVCQLMEKVRAPKVLVIYEGERHSIAHYPGVRTTLADWLIDRLNSKPFTSEKVYVETTGKEVKTRW